MIIEFSYGRNIEVNTLDEWMKLHEEIKCSVPKYMHNKRVTAKQRISQFKKEFGVDNQEIKSIKKIDDWYYVTFISDHVCKIKGIMAELLAVEFERKSKKKNILFD